MPAKMGFTIQAGAFSRAENAAKLTGKLNREGLSAYYFVYKTGLYKVRFGNFRIGRGRGGAGPGASWTRASSRSTGSPTPATMPSP